MKRILFLVICTGLLSTLFAAPIVNGNFENGLTGYSTNILTNGSVFTTSSIDGIIAKDGSPFVAIKATAELSQTISAGKDESLIFDWYYDGQDYSPYNDYAMLTLAGSGTNVSWEYGIVDVGNLGKSGWQTFSYTFQKDFAGSMTFGSINVLDDKLSSYLYLDNIKISPVAAVSEPGILLLLGMGLFGLSGIFLRKKKI